MPPKMLYKNGSLHSYVLSVSVKPNHCMRINTFENQNDRSAGLTLMVKHVVLILFHVICGLPRLLQATYCSFS
jgi:hypothetical protein